MSYVCVNITDHPSNGWNCFLLSHCFNKELFLSTEHIPSEAFIIFFPFQLSFRCWYVKQNGKNQHPALLPWCAQPVCQNCWWRYRKDWKWLYQVIFSFHHSQEDRLLHSLWNSCSSENGRWNYGNIVLWYCWPSALYRLYSIYPKYRRDRHREVVMVCSFGTRSCITSGKKPIFTSMGIALTHQRETSFSSQHTGSTQGLCFHQSM